MTTEKKKIFLDLIFNALLPIIIGTLIYRIPAVYKLTFIQNYIPDALWAYALSSTIFIIWNRKINYTWLIILFLFFIAFETAQFYKIIVGTGDLWDIIAYISGTLVVILSNSRMISYFYQNKN
jgi:hypothetical protein